ncbi:MAG: hypothetical protein JNM00_12820, partial [Flavobacteriales bacterium]|nr:hypothetical protein [Flavobacteriales bacterium]
MKTQNGRSGHKAMMASSAPHYIQNIWQTSRLFALAALLFLASGLTAQEKFSRSPLNPGIYQLNQPGYTLLTARCASGAFVSVEVKKGVTYTFSTCGIAWDTELILREKGRHGAELASDDDGCGLENGPSEIIWRAEESMVIQVCLSGGNPSHSSTITISRNGIEDHAVPTERNEAVVAETTPEEEREGINSTEEISNTMYADTDLPAAGSALQDAYLDHIDATYSDQQVALHWKTTGEVNTTEFNIERSSDGNSFAAIGSVKASGNSDEVHQYWFIDYAPPFGKVYYRLVFPGENDAIGEKTALIETGGNLEVMSVFPNPSSSDFTLR